MCAPNKLVVIGRGLLMVTAGLMAAGLIASQLHAQTFSITQNGQPVGDAHLTIGREGNGYRVQSSSKIEMDGLKYKFQENQVTDLGLHLRSVDLSGTVNGTPVKISGAPNGQQFLLNIDANGSTTKTPLQFATGSVFFPDFDAASLQILLDIGAQSNNRNLSALVPKQAGSASPVRVVTDRDEEGELDGKQVVVHHLTVNFDNSQIELFSGAQNELLQSEWMEQAFAMVRKGFKLYPPARPNTAPPVANPRGQNQPAAAPQH